MKKLLFTLAFVATVVAAQAQLFVAGSIGFDKTSGNSEFITTIGNEVQDPVIDYADRTTSFVIAPAVGYMFSDVMGFGATIGYETSTLKSCTDVEKKEFGNKYNVQTFGIQPFFRYVFGDFGNIKLYADAKLPIAFHTEKATYKDEDTTIEEKGPKGFGIGLYVVPAFTYQFNEHISINAELGLLSLGWSQVKNSYTEEYGEVLTEGWEKENEFGVGVNTRVPVQFGFVYTF